MATRWAVGAPGGVRVRRTVALGVGSAAATVAACLRLRLARRGLVSALTGSARRCDSIMALGPDSAHVEIHSEFRIENMSRISESFIFHISAAIPPSLVSASKIITY